MKPEVAGSAEARYRRPPMKRLAQTLVLSPVALVAVFACGPGGEAKVPVLGAGPAPSASAQTPAPSPLPSGLPDALPVPPMGVKGSHVAKLEADASASCTRGASGAGAGRPEEALARLVASCKLRPLGPAFAAQSSDGDPAKETRFQAKAGRCYRVLSARDASITDLVVVVRDGHGDTAAEGPEVAIPRDGKLCFSSDDAATVLVSVGTGRGAFAVQVVEP